MSKHTPGPWSAFIGKDGKTISVSIGEEPNGRRPCIVDWPGFDGTDLPMGERRANARLISAAPELLEMLCAALPFIDDAEPDPAYKAGYVARVSEQIRALIAKATGAK